MPGRAIAAQRARPRLQQERAGEVQGGGGDVESLDIAIDDDIADIRQAVRNCSIACSGLPKSALENRRSSCGAWRGGVRFMRSGGP